MKPAGHIKIKNKDKIDEVYAYPIEAGGPLKGMFGVTVIQRLLPGRGFSVSIKGATCGQVAACFIRNLQASGQPITVVVVFSSFEEAAFDIGGSKQVHVL